MGILSSVGVRLTDWLSAATGGPLTRADARLWAEARTLDDLGRLTAMWLRGEIQSQPGYYGPVDVDEGDAPGLTDALVACNLAGFVTRSSQSGVDFVASDGVHVEGLASVTGYADDDKLAWLIAEIMRPGPYEVRAWKAAKSRPRFGWGPDEDCCPVTFTDGQTFTSFGRGTVGDVEFEYDGAGEAAVAEAVAAWQVTVYDPEPGRNTLWAALYDAATRAALTPMGVS